MRRILVVLVAVVLLAVGLTVLAGSPRPNVPPATSVRVGTVAPDFTLQSYGGDSVTLANLRGKVVIINFWATWCPPCRTEKPRMEKLYQHFAERGDLEILAVNVEEDAQRALATYFQQHSFTFPILLDSAARVQGLYRVYRFPESFIVDRNGIVVDHVIGARDWDDPRTIAYFNRLLSE